MIRIVTSESVNCGHPDKTCDIIADSFLDAALSQDKDCQMAVECAIKDNKLMIYGESTTTAKINYEDIAKKVLKDIGYTNKFEFVKTLSQQSPNIANAVIKDELCANDQGIMFGYANDETEEYMPLPIMLAHKLARRLAEVRKNGMLRYLRPDGKTQVTVLYDEDEKPVCCDTILLSTQHSDSVSQEQIRQDIIDFVIKFLPTETI